MNTLKFLAAVTVLFIFVDACKKPDTTTSVVSTYPTYSSMDTIYQMLEVKPKYVTVNGATGDTFYGTSGTRYIIPPNCLQDGTGNPVTTNVQFEVAEYLKKGDMIFSKMLPISDNEPLLSGGEISIKATISGLPIYLKPGGCTFSATIPRDKDTTSGMEFFTGVPNTNVENSNVNWRPKRDSSIGVIVYNGDTITIISDSIKERNADRFLSDPDYQSITISVSASGSVILDATTKINAYALFDNYKAVWPVGFYHTGSYTNGIFKENHVPDIPTHFAVFGLINNRFYAGVTAATPKTGENYTVTLTETDPAAFKAQLNNLTK